MTNTQKVYNALIEHGITSYETGKTEFGISRLWIKGEGSVLLTRHNLAALVKYRLVQTDGVRFWAAPAPPQNENANESTAAPEKGADETFIDIVDRYSGWLIIGMLVVTLLMLLCLIAMRYDDMQIQRNVERQTVAAPTLATDDAPPDCTLIDFANDKVTDTNQECDEIE